MKMENGKVTIKIVSERGDDQILLAPADALNRVQTEVKNNGRWLYLDGVFTSVDNVTSEDLATANEIVLGDTLKGG